jgi:hypothetical protein
MIKKNMNVVKNFYKDFLEFQSEEYNLGLALWDDIDNEYKKNYYEDNLKVIELE